MMTESLHLFLVKLDIFIHVHIHIHVHNCYLIAVFVNHFTSFILSGSSHQLSGTSGVLAHPGYPNKYDNNVDSTWLIETHPSTKIKLNFNSFALEESANCVKDYVEIYDGSSKRDRLIGRYCGTSNPGSIESTGRQMFVIFNSNSKQPNYGFLARWNVEKSLTNKSKYEIHFVIIWK